MRIALIGDIHANLPALEAVLDHAAGAGAEAIWNIGDFVGYHAFPDEVVQRIRRETSVSVVGNYDLKVLRVPEKQEKWRKEKVPEKWLAFAWAYEHLFAESRDYLASLPRELRFEVTGKRLLLVHGSPESIDEHLLPDTPEERLRELAQLAAADLVICGHSHQPFVREVDGVLFINTGSVGRPDDGDPRACYALLDLNIGNAPFVTHHRLEYDVQRAIDALRANGLPEDFVRMAQQGKSLAAIQQPTEEALLAAAKNLAERCSYDAEHSAQVARLALRLFDALQPLHHLGAHARHLLHLAGLLHDIGWVEGGRRHHKASLRLIMDAAEIPFTPEERLIVGSVARYHRKALPAKEHEHYMALPREARHVVDVLAACLRCADGLDCTHYNIVHDVSATVTGGKITLNCTVNGPAEAERQDALVKGDLLIQVFARKLVVTCTPR
ncbi:MAG TPA: YfcE family phosphodiesterase [Armatimonadota bacterium]